MFCCHQVRLLVVRIKQRSSMQCVTMSDTAALTRSRQGPGLMALREQGGGVHKGRQASSGRFVRLCNTVAPLLSFLMSRTMIRKRLHPTVRWARSIQSRQN